MRWLSSARRRPSPVGPAVRRCAAFACLALALAAPVAHAQSEAPRADLEIVATGLEQPIALAAPDDGSGRLFVAEKTGRVRVVIPGEGVLAAPLVDLRGRVRTRSEQGLLGIALHPRFAENGRVFLHYSADLGGDPGVSTVAEFHLDPLDANRLRPEPVRVLLTVAQPFANHNGGQLAFGPDGYLYVALGDGGSGGDPLEHGQNPATLLGSILRLDVDGARLAPASNPFVGDPERRDEIWAYGLRNPWRFSFDRETGDLWIADVGQSAVEEINREPAGGPGGRDYGWNTVEGDRCFDPPSGCDAGATVAPLLTYRHDSGWGRSVTGGYRYRGSGVPDLRGAYVFGDFVSGRVFAMLSTDDGRWSVAEPLAATFAARGGQLRPASFGEDAAGELYLLDFGGTVYRFVSAP